MAAEQHTSPRIGLTLTKFGNGFFAKSSPERLQAILGNGFGYTASPDQVRLTGKAVFQVEATRDYDHGSARYIINIPKDIPAISFGEVALFEPDTNRLVAVCSFPQLTEVMYGEVLRVYLAVPDPAQDSEQALDTSIKSYSILDLLPPATSVSGNKFPPLAVVGTPNGDSAVATSLNGRWSIPGYFVLTTAQIVIKDGEINLELERDLDPAHEIAFLQFLSGNAKGTIKTLDIDLNEKPLSPKFFSSLGYQVVSGDTVSLYSPVEPTSAVDQVTEDELRATLKTVEQTFGKQIALLAQSQEFLMSIIGATKDEANSGLINLRQIHSDLSLVKQEMASLSKSVSNLYSGSKKNGK